MPIVIPDPITKPFCNSGDKVLPPVGSSLVVQSQEKGIPPRQAMPLDTAQGLPVKIEEFNGTMNFYSQQIQALVSGGQFTFNQAVSDENGGYPEGVRLFDEESGTHQVSQHSNNTANFVTDRTKYNNYEDWKGELIANSLTISPTQNNDGLNLVSTNSGRILTLNADPDQTFEGTFTWPKDFPLQDGPSALCTVNTPPDFTESKWVSLKSRLTYNLTTRTLTAGETLIKFDTLSSSLYVYGTPYSPTTGLFTAPYDGTYKFEFLINVEQTGDSSAEFWLVNRDGAAPSVYYSTIASRTGFMQTASGTIYLELTDGQTVGVTCSIPFTPGGFSTIVGQLTISWKI